MNSVGLSRLRSEALELSEPERAELAYDLVISLDGPPDLESTREWDLEIVRRLDEVEAGTARVVDRSEFQRRMREPRLTCSKEISFR